MLFHVALAIIVLSMDLCGSLPTRRRRDLADVLAPDFLCPLQCSMTHSSAWSKLSNFELKSFDNMTTTQVLRAATAGSTVLNDTFNSLCMVYQSYSNCLARCPNGLLTSNLRSGMTAMGVLCDQSNSGYVSQTPCIYNNRDLVKAKCNSATDDLFSITSGLQTLFQANSGGLASKLPSFSDLCSAANQRASCILPTVQQSCGTQATGLLQSILRASLSNLRVSVGDQWQQLSSPECISFFQTVKDGISLKLDSANATLPMNNTTTAQLEQTNVTEVIVDTQAGTAGSFKTTRSWVHPRAVQDQAVMPSSGAARARGFSIVTCLNGISTAGYFSMRIFEILLGLKLLSWYWDHCLW